MEDYYDFLRTRAIDPFKKKNSRKNRIAQQLNEQYQSIIPTMPCKQNADYLWRKIWFERHLEYLNSEGTILIGNSLGASFLTKWLSENSFPQKVEQLHLIATPIKDTSFESITNFRPHEENIPSIEIQTQNIFLYHSIDDTVVPYSHTEKLAILLPKAKLTTFTDRWHFHQETFPELLENIQQHK